MLGLPGLDDDTATTPPAADQPRRLRDHRHRLLGGALAHGQQLLIEIEEHDHISPIDTVQHGLCADRHPSLGALLRCRRDLVDRFTKEGLEFLPGSLDTHSERLEGRGATHGADDGSALRAVSAHEFVVDQPHDLTTVVAADQLTARRAGEQTSPTRAVEDAHHSPITVDVASKIGGERPRLGRILVAPVEHVDDRPVVAFDRSVTTQEGAGTERFERRHRRGHHGGHPRPTRPFEGDLASVPCRGAFFLEPLVVFVDHDNSSEIRHRHPCGRAGADDRRTPSCSRPLVGGERHRDPGPAQRHGEMTGPSRVGREDQGIASATGSERNTQPVVIGCDSDRGNAMVERVVEDVARSSRNRITRPTFRRSCDHALRRRRPQERHPATGPTPRRPPG